MERCSVVRLGPDEETNERKSKANMGVNFDDKFLVQLHRNTQEAHDN